MPTIPRTGVDQLVDLKFPKCGIDLTGPFSKQKPRQIEQSKEYGATTPQGRNMRAFPGGLLDLSRNEAFDRRRGGSRCGLVKYNSSAIVTDKKVQMLDTLVG